MQEAATILLVDDTDAQRYALSRVLRTGGYRVEEATSGEEALQKASARPDLILLDVGLPDLDGYEVCRRIKSDPATRSIPILQMSASYVSPRHKVMGLEGGADGYLTPPLEGPELLANVRAMLRMRAAEDRAARQTSEIEAARAELHAVLHSLAEGLLRMDRDGCICYANSAAERLLGYPSETIRGFRFHDLVHRNLSSCAKQSCPVAKFSGDLKGTLESVFVRKDGYPLTIEYTASPYAVGGEVEGVVVSFRDIGERKRSEEALRATEKLASTGRMAATIAHEINNPLEAITNLVYLISVSPSLDNDTRRYVDMAQAELSRVTHISKQTLGFYRQSSNAGEFSLSDVAEGVLGVMERKLKAAEIEVVRRYQAKIMLRGHAGEMRQVISNLILNAMEAVGTKGRIWLHIHKGRDWRNGREGVRFMISDTGSGIPRNKLKQIFEPFFTTKQEKGTGLGLWVSNGIVHKHGGYMRVRSSQSGAGHGTCFSIFLPLVNPHA
ncbi:PAS/PAC sensor hybrid histidine kinase [Candidatus Koribacter versatilis Ellin345]|uniref:histidine kinase n=1 Tax=Koribacter versatilis (strain Ellin345) TaxID=204669 RepID=Q1INY8_KORVE|nr:ATP-binding protein [Candidatus Koribacter versatilis]ABF41412.1 PAS/PAC sensor hybrid histidine kinase [Candidatus Koribacter versatilis Ellin345]